MDLPQEIKIVLRRLFAESTDNIINRHALRPTAARPTSSLHSLQARWRQFVAGEAASYACAAGDSGVLSIALERVHTPLSLLPHAA
ncbi:MAG TPA: hypothetical protein VGS41_07815 [Chthonomonadales bacterium]|nr:hypothetical protein [Chthonomonadales bacterium]